MRWNGSTNMTRNMFQKQGEVIRSFQLSLQSSSKTAADLNEARLRRQNCRCLGKDRETRVSTSIPHCRAQPLVPRSRNHRELATPNVPRIHVHSIVAAYIGRYAYTRPTRRRRRGCAADPLESSDHCGKYGGGRNQANDNPRRVFGSLTFYQSSSRRHRMK